MVEKITTVAGRLEQDSREVIVNADAANEVQVFPDLTDDANRRFGRHGRNRTCKCIYLIGS